MEARELQLLRLGENALYRVMSTDLLLRVARTGANPHDIARTVAAATVLRASGIPVCEPVALDGPMVFENGVVSVWKYYAERSNGQVDFRGFGRILKKLHADSDELASVLPNWDPLGTIRRRLRLATAIQVPDGWVHDLARRTDDFENVLTRFEPQLSTGVIHGDAHTGNLVDSVDGQILIDLDDLANGPQDADFAPTIVQMRRFGLAADRWVDLTTGYGLADPSILHNSPLVRLRELFMLVWLLQQYGNSAAIDEEIKLRVESLDDRAGSLTRWNAR
jgi:Ser/Thr protein kinase RdoA (MazF antagonist)